LKTGHENFAQSHCQKLETKGNSVSATIEQGGTSSISTYDRVIMAVGITGNVENLGLEVTKAKVDRGHIVIINGAKRVSLASTLSGMSLAPHGLHTKPAMKALSVLKRSPA